MAAIRRRTLHNIGALGKYTGDLDAEEIVSAFTTVAASQECFQSLFSRLHSGSGEDAVLLLHGLTSSPEMFVLPETENLVNSLLAHGFSDIWLFDWRGSYLLPYNEQGDDSNVDSMAVSIAMSAELISNSSRPACSSETCNMPSLMWGSGDSCRALVSRMPVTAQKDL